MRLIIAALLFAILSSAARADNDPATDTKLIEKYNTVICDAALELNWRAFIVKVREIGVTRIELAIQNVACHPGKTGEQEGAAMSFLHKVAAEKQNPRYFTGDVVNFLLTKGHKDIFINLVKGRSWEAVIIDAIIVAYNKSEGLPKVQDELYNMAGIICRNIALHNIAELQRIYESNCI